MEIFNYKICSEPLGRGINDKIFIIQEVNNPLSLLVAKIYDHNHYFKYFNEQKILNKISETQNSNNYLLNLKNTEVILEHDENNPDDSNFLIFDYLIHGNLYKYLEMTSISGNIKEKYVKLLCYKILLGLKKCHKEKICHNKIDLANIMLDKDFNPIIIHFGDAKIDENKFNKDFKGLGILLAKLISSGKYKTIRHNKKRKINMMNKNFLNNKYLIEDKKNFLKSLEMQGIIVSEEFKKFFEILVKSESEIIIDDLIKNDWLKEAIDNKIEIEENLKIEFEKIYNLIINSQELDKYNFDLTNTLDLNNQNTNLKNLLVDSIKSIELENPIMKEEEKEKKECENQKKNEHMPMHMLEPGIISRKKYNRNLEDIIKMDHLENLREIDNEKEKIMIGDDLEEKLIEMKNKHEKEMKEINNSFKKKGDIFTIDKRGIDADVVVGKLDLDIKEKKRLENEEKNYIKELKKIENEFQKFKEQEKNNKLSLSYEILGKKENIINKEYNQDKGKKEIISEKNIIRKEYKENEEKENKMALHHSEFQKEKLKKLENEILNDEHEHELKLKKIDFENQKEKGSHFNEKIEIKEEKERSENQFQKELDMEKLKMKEESDIIKILLNLKESLDLKNTKMNRYNQYNKDQNNSNMNSMNPLYNMNYNLYMSNRPYINNMINPNNMPNSRNMPYMNYNINNTENINNNANESNMENKSNMANINNMSFMNYMPNINNMANSNNMSYMNNNIPTINYNENINNKANANIMPIINNQSNINNMPNYNNMPYMNYYPNMNMNNSPYINNPIFMNNNLPMYNIGHMNTYEKKIEKGPINNNEFNNKKENTHEKKFKEKLIIKKIKYKPKGIMFNFFEIDIFGNNNSCYEFLNKYINDLAKKIEIFYELYEYLEIILDKDYLKIIITFKENNENKDDKENNNIIDIDEELYNDSFPLTIEIEIVELVDKNVEKNKNIFYLMFNYIEGNLEEFYEYLKEIKKVSKDLIEEYNKKKIK